MAEKRDTGIWTKWDEVFKGGRLLTPRRVLLHFMYRFMGCYVKILR